MFWEPYCWGGPLYKESATVGLRVQDLEFRAGESKLQSRAHTRVLGDTLGGSWDPVITLNCAYNPTYSGKTYLGAVMEVIIGLYTH